MVASTRIQALASGSDLVTILSEYLENPKLIDELSAEVVTLNTLTDEQSEQLEEAKILIQQRDALNKEIEAQRQTQADEKAAFDAASIKAKKESDDYVAANQELIAKANAALDAREEELTDFKTRLDQRENQMLEKAATVQSLFQSGNIAQG